MFRPRINFLIQKGVAVYDRVLRQGRVSNAYCDMDKAVTIGAAIE